jgi:ABC-type Na+ efflux pump permease subunit
MTKIVTITIAEIRAFVQTKAFLVSMLLVPLLTIVGPIATAKLQASDTTPRPFAVVDATGSLYGAFERAAAERDRAIAAGTSTKGQARFIPSLVRLDDGTSLEQQRIRLSERVRKGELFAFVEIPADVLTVGAEAPSRIAYVSDSPTYFALREWIDGVLVREVRARRYDAVGIAPDVVARLERPVRCESIGLWRPSATGGATAAPPINYAQMFVPLFTSALLLMLVMLTTSSMLNAVIEEKMSRISEVLLGSVTPFELMLGKLLGGTLVSLGLGLVYVVSGISVARRMGHGDLVSPAIVAWFVVFLILALLMYGALFLAVGAACSDFKEGQSMLMPVVFLGMMPFFFILPAIIESPGGKLSVFASLFPTMAPFAMLARLGIHPAPATWQVAVSVAVTVASALGCVWAAGRIFRVGLLMQGKGASFAQMVRWITTR